MSNKRIITREYEIPGREDVNTLTVELYYDLGGYNFMTYKPKPRGFYLSITPEMVTKHCREYVAFSGVAGCIYECSRYSKKAQTEAMKLFYGKETEYVERFCKENGYKATFRKETIYEN